MGVWHALAFAAILLAPAAAASWYGPGGEEPDTHIDWQRQGMFLQPGDALANRVYFDAYAALPQTSENPNVALLGSSVLLPGSVEYRALLGVWRDCNGDGAIGAADTALQEYHASLANADTCPAGSPFNDGLWVSEMLMIGAVDPCEYLDDATREADCAGTDAFHANERVLYVNGTRVWGDQGRPGEPAPSECPLAPLPRGTTSGTGALLRYADCHDGTRVATTVNDVDADGSLGLRFDDTENPQEGDSALNQHFPVNLLGNPATGQAGLLEEDTGRPAFHAWDCDASLATLRDPTASGDERGSLSELRVADPSGNQLDGQHFPYAILTTFVPALTFHDRDGNPETPGELVLALDGDGRGTYARVPAPASAPTLDTGGSAWDAAAAAQDAARGDCDPATRDELAQNPGETIESGPQPVRQGARDRNSFVLAFYDGHRGLNENVDDTTGPTTPSDAGLLVRRQDRGGAGPMWRALAATTQDPQLVDRHTLAPARPAYTSFYARIGTDAPMLLTLPPGAGIYGADACPFISPGAPDANGWVCDPTRWWRDAGGNDATPRDTSGAPLGQAPGAEWHLLDVDCRDGQLARGVPVHASLVLASDSGTCERPR